MKIKDIKVGEEVAVLDSPSKRTYRSDVPRQARVVEIVTETKTVRTGYGYGPRENRNIKRVKIVLLDAAQREYSRYGNSWDKIAAAKKGEEIVVETKQVIGSWVELGPEVLKKAEWRQKSDAMRDDLNDRLDALVGDELGGRIHVSVRRQYGDDYGLDPSTTISGGQLIRLIELAEKGAK